MTIGMRGRIRQGIKPSLRQGLRVDFLSEPNSTIDQSLQSIQVTPSSPGTLHTLGVSVVQLTATGTFLGGLIDDITSTVLWQSTNPLVATVVAGLVVGLVPGTVTISATLNGITDSVTVTVAL